MTAPLPSRRRAQTVVEYMLGVAVLMVALAIGFYALSDSTKLTFDNVRRTVALPFP